MEIMASQALLGVLASALVTSCVGWVPSTFLGTCGALKEWSPTFNSKQNDITEWKMGMQITIRIVGRKQGNEKWLEEGYEMYEKRLRPTSLEVSTVWHKSDPELIRNVEADISKGHCVVLLDPVGSTRTSEEFSKDLFGWLQQGGSRLSFVIGGAPGLPPELTGPISGLPVLSMSSMTFTHQFARTIIMEQIYRASEIRRGSSYHK
jgi:23S rRNA (pseudouridine1915-N3)-methyltransferase